MRLSQFHIHTEKEAPADAEIVSHRLMLRAGLIRKHAAGIYTWTPLGLRVMRKVEAVIREEMNAAGALEMLMPAVQPAELWQESKRWDKYGDLLLRMKDRAERDYCFGPTHEEIVTDFARSEVRSYKQLPLTVYQIQTKFRDEIRPRFGVMRAREFLMKDAYSFHLDAACLRRNGYEVMYDAYTKIFTRLGLEFRPVQADSGEIGGNNSHEFHVLADSGEDAIAISDQSQFAANVEKAEAISEINEAPAGTQQMERVETPGVTTIDQLCELVGAGPEQCLKTLVVSTEENGLVALVLRGDHALNRIKAGKLEQIKSGFDLADPAEIQAQLGCSVGSIGPVGLNIPTIVDRAAAVVADFYCGANEDGVHLSGCNWGRDAELGEVADLRNVVAGDPSPDGQGRLEIVRGIEVGHVFELGSQYAEALQATVLNEQGKSIAMEMGCYGIGVSRTVAAAIEQNHDDRGIIWPEAMAPYQVALLPMNMHKSHRVAEECERIYGELVAEGFEVLWDDRPVRPGVMFAESELLGIPHRIIVGERGIDNGTVEFKPRTATKSEDVAISDLLKVCKERIGS